MTAFTLLQAAGRSGEFFPSRALPNLIWAAVWLAVLVCAAHAARRARGGPRAPRLARYLRNQRLYHWGNSAVLAILAISGFLLFARRAPATLPGLSWLSVHEWTGVLFAAGVAFHALAAVRQGESGSMRLRLADLREVVQVGRVFFFGGRTYPQPGKYEALQKLYHAALAVLAVVFVATGALMWAAISRWTTPPREWLEWSRLAHLLAAAALAALVIGHLYFSLIRANRENLRDMLGCAPAGRDV